jgi:hypothetical protein
MWQDRHQWYHAICQYAIVNVQHHRRVDRITFPSRATRALALTVLIIPHLTLLVNTFFILFLGFSELFFENHFY